METSRCSKCNFQESQWQGEHGNQYTLRNPQNPEQMDALYLSNFGLKRTELNQEFLGGLPRNLKILEVGCNSGVQLALLQKMGFTCLYGVEVNRSAIEKAKIKGIDIVYGSAFDLPFKDNFFDLVFTSGVLIHIPPNFLAKAMEEIFRVSGKYVWGTEYFSENLQEIVYQGKKDLLWKADFCQIYLDYFLGLKLLKKRSMVYLDNPVNFDEMFLLEKI